MSFCIVSGCTNRKKNKNYEQLEKENKNNKTIAFHIFPKDIEKKKKWLKALNLENYNPPKTGAVCSEHFKEYDYNLEHTLRKLKREAVPYLIEEEITKNKNKNTNIDNTKSMIQYNDIKKIISTEANICNDKRAYMDTTENKKVKIEVHHEHHSALVEENIYNDETIDTGTNENDIKIEIHHEHDFLSTEENIYNDRIIHAGTTESNDVKMEVHHEYHSISTEDNMYGDKIMDTGTNEDNDVKIGLRYQHRSTSISPDRILNGSKKNQLKDVHRKEINRLKSQLYTSSYKLKKAQEKVKSLQLTLKDLQKRNLLVLKKK